MSHTERVRALEGWRRFVARTGMTLVGILLVSTAGTVFAGVSEASGFPMATVTGTVTGAVGGAGQAGVCVYLDSPSGGVVFTGATNASGQYTITAYGSGASFVVQFDPSCQGSSATTLAGQYYNGTTSGTTVLADAMSIYISPGSSPYPVDASLSDAAGLSGQITDANGPVMGRTCVTLEDHTDGWSYHVTASGSSYALAGITPDTYLLEFDPTCGGSSSSTDVPQYYDENAAGSAAGTYTFTTSDVTTPPVVNVTLASGAGVYGSVTSPSGTGLDNVCMTISSAQPAVLFSYTSYTLPGGIYGFTDLPAVEWTVSFDPTCGGHPSDYASNNYGGSTPMEFSTSPGQTLTGINGTLPYSAGPPMITTSSLPGGTVGVPYSQTVTVAGGTPSYYWSVLGLPTGLSFNPYTGLVSGTANSAGTFVTRVTVTDSAFQVLSSTANVTISMVNPGGSSASTAGTTSTTSTTSTPSTPSTPSTTRSSSGGASVPLRLELGAGVSGRTGVFRSLLATTRPGVATLTATYATRVTRMVDHRRRIRIITRPFGSASESIAAGTTLFTVRPSASALVALARAPALRVTETLVFISYGGARATVRRAMTVRYVGPAKAKHGNPSPKPSKSQ